MAQSQKYNLSELPETQKPAVPIRRVSSSKEIVSSIAFGRGLIRPFVRDGQGDFANSDGIELVRASVGQVLGTVGSSSITSGEIPWRPEFGSVLTALRFRSLDETTVELARVHVGDALRNWLPRIQVRDIQVRTDFDRSLLVVTVHYDILSSNRQSVVAPSQSTTASIPVAA